MANRWGLELHGLQRPPSIGVAIVTLNRSDELAQAVKALLGQSYPAAAIVISAVTENDVGRVANLDGLEIIFGSAGCCAQRNRAIERLNGRCDVIAFFDDDYVASKYALEGIAHLFGMNADISGATGHLLANGINTGGVPEQHATALLDAYDAAERDDLKIVDHVHGLYGCNMAFRFSSIGAERFDERMPLYGWQEDIDFAARIGRRGRIVWSNAFAGVHRGAKKGRTSGVRLGYSQISNPWYMVKKGTMQKSYAIKLVLRNVTANLLRSFRPEPWVDRRGRVRGNLLAASDFLRGKLDPERIVDIN